MAFWKPGTAQPTKNETKPTIGSSSSSTNKIASITKPGINVPAAPAAVLSKSVMGMKFMKRKDEAVALEQQERVKFEQINNTSWIVDESSDSAMLVEDAAEGDSGELQVAVEEVDVFSALPGRRSFGGFNKAVEKHYEQMVDHKRFQRAAKQPESAVGDEEMLLRYETLVGLPRGPNQGLRQDTKPGTKNNSSNKAVPSADKPAAHTSKSKTLHMGTSRGVEMEEITHFEDRKGGAAADNNKRKHNQQAGGNAASYNQKPQQNHQQNSKKFKR